MSGMSVDFLLGITNSILTTATAILIWSRLTGVLGLRTQRLAHFCGIQIRTEVETRFLRYDHFIGMYKPFCTARINISDSCPACLLKSNVLAE